jgi:murein tripeptide amidase MpaA
VRVSSRFDGGNIEVLSADRPDAVRLRIRKDAGDRFFQWFSFRVSGARGQALALHIENAGEASYARGWEGYEAVRSVDLERWTRAETAYEDGVLTIRDVPERDVVHYAYFAPYPLEHHRTLVARCLMDPRVRGLDLGPTVDGRALDVLSIGEGPLQLWFPCRQHPGESMAEHWAEGFLDRLLDASDPVSLELLRRATVHVVPNMNPDGTVRGHLRTNAAGANLNRAWSEPSLEESPEVHRVRERMEATGVHLCLDVHGDEALPHNFIAGSDGIASWNAERQALLDDFRERLARRSPDFQTAKGYPPAPPGKANMKLCTNWVAERFGALAMTLEMPFKDCADRPDPLEGWSPARCRHLAHACLDVVLETLDAL